MYLYCIQDDSPNMHDAQHNGFLYDNEFNRLLIFVILLNIPP